MTELSNFLLAECEALARSEDPKAPKCQKVAKAKQEGNALESPEKVAALQSPPKAAPSGPPPVAKGACKFWCSSTGCKLAHTCKFLHDR